MGYRRVTVRDASELLGVSEHAIRQRIRRNTLESEKDADGRVYVLLDLNTEASVETSGVPSDNTSDVECENRMIREQNEILREQLAEAHAANRENRRIIMALTQRIPELEPVAEAPSEALESPVTASEESSKGGYDREETEEPKKHPWWRRIFE